MHTLVPVIIIVQLPLAVDWDSSNKIRSIQSDPVHTSVGGPFYELRMQLTEA